MALRRTPRAGGPIATALDLLGRRWTLRILWELRGGPLRATELQARCDRMSLSVLYQRLRELMDADLVRQNADDWYELTKYGTELGVALEPLDTWSRRWARSQSARSRARR